MRRKLMAIQTDVLKMVRRQGLLLNQGTFHYKQVLMICFFQLQEPIWRVYCSWQALQHPGNKWTPKLMSMEDSFSTFFIRIQAFIDKEENIYKAQRHIKHKPKNQKNKRKEKTKEINQRNNSTLFPAPYYYISFLVICK